jgi:oligoribonuclease NrnB/cAMP/cGMP phosphodiesterase (DHH superfamily)
MTDILPGLPRPEVIITHESDLDGLVSGILLQRLAEQLFGQKVPLEAYHYNNWRQRELREKHAWVADFSFEARLDKPGWVVIDHHASEVPAKCAMLIHDLKKSAGTLCYELCRKHGLGSDKLDRLVHLNNVSDLFLEEDPEFELANDYANLVKNYQFWNVLSVLDGKIEDLIDHPLLEVMKVKRRVEDPIGLRWSRSNITEITPALGYVETVIGNTNLIVHQLLEQPELPYDVLMTLFRRANGAMIASFRSRNGDALKFAEKLQGGGHSNASGASLPRSIKTPADAVQYLRQHLNPKPEELEAGVQSLFEAIESGPKGMT